MAKRPCARPGCRNLVERGYCAACAPVHSAKARSEATRVRGESKRWYNSARWKAARKGYLAKHPFCADPYRRHVPRLEMATDVDHVQPHRESWEMFWDPANWQGLCKGCHSTKTAREDGGFGRLESTTCMV